MPLSAETSDNRRSRSAAWLPVILGGFMEAAWASFMKLSDGFTDIPYVALMLVFMAFSMLLLNRGFKAGLPTGACYAVWVGIGSVATLVAGILFFDEAVEPLGWLFVAMIVAGVVGMDLSDSVRDHMSRPQRPSVSMTLS